MATAASVSQVQSQDKEGEAERRRELEEEQMAQAGQPQKLEEDLDQAQQQEEEDEPEAQQPDENALEPDGARSQQVSCPSALSSALWTGPRGCKEGADVWYTAADGDVPAPGPVRGWLGRPLQ